MLPMIIQPTKYEKLSNFQGFVSSKRTEYMAAIHGYNQAKRRQKEFKETNRQNVDEKNLKRQTDKQTKRGRKESKETNRQTDETNVDEKNLKRQTDKQTKRM